MKKSGKNHLSEETGYYGSVPLQDLISGWRIFSVEETGGL